MKGTDNGAWIKTNVAVIGRPGSRWRDKFSMTRRSEPRELQLGLFARGTDRAVWTQTNTGSGWSGWVARRIVTSRPAAVVSGGRIDVLGQGTDQAIWTRSRVNGSWSSWTSLADAPVLHPPTTVTAGTGLCMYLFAAATMPLLRALGPADGRHGPLWVA